MHSFADVPAHVRTALTPQMRRVLEHQLDRLARQDAAGSPPTHNAEAETQSGRPNGADDAGTLVAAARREYLDERKFWNEGGPEMHVTRELHFDAAGTSVPARMYRPSSAEVLPAIIYFHGGGFMLGNLDSHDRIARAFAAASGAAVVAVDYSLAPEAPFPQALLECAGVIAQLALHGERCGVDRERLVVAGDSAGAALALGATLLLRDEPSRVPEVAAGPDRVLASLRAMLLYYGGYGLEASPSRDTFGGFWDGLSPDDLSLIHETYLIEPTDRESPYNDPLSADLTTPLPPAFLIGAELDPLRDDTVRLGQRLAAAGHDVQWSIVPGVLHSFLHFGRMLDEAVAAIDAGATFAREHLGR